MMKSIKEFSYNNIKNIVIFFSFILDIRSNNILDMFPYIRYLSVGKISK